MLSQNYFDMFGLAVDFAVDSKILAANYRKLQTTFHPDKFAHASDTEQRRALQTSALINQAYETLKQPTKRAAYMLELSEGSVRREHTMRPDPEFLMQQIEWRETLMDIDGSPDPEQALTSFMEEVKQAAKPIETSFTTNYLQGDFASAHHDVDKMQFIYKLLDEAEAVEARLLDE